MTEKNILAYFKTPEEAEQVKAKLTSLRAIDVSIDRFSKYPGDGADDIMNPITSEFGSLGNLTLDASFSSKSSGIMAATDVSASGFSDGGQGGPTGRDILLTAVMPEDTHHKALKVIEEAGGLT